jgi:hypothetical protein
MDYIIARLSERSTWQGLVALVGAFGVTLDPTLTDAIVTFGIAAIGLIHVLWPESGAPSK